jgi:integrase
VLAIPTKRHERRLLTWLTEPEVDALLAAPDHGTWAGRRDHAMLVLAVQTGLRISELIALSHGDITLDTGAHVRCMSKDRKERATPLTGLTVAVLDGWLAEHAGEAQDPLFPTRTGTRLSCIARTPGSPTPGRQAILITQPSRRSTPTAPQRHTPIRTFEAGCGPLGSWRTGGARLDLCPQLSGSGARAKACDRQ